MAQIRTPLTSDEELLCAEHAITQNDFSDEQRLDRMRAEMAEGFSALAGVSRGASLFGSARTPVGHRDYELARETALALGSAGFAIITGGGPGIMQAANQGALLGRHYWSGLFDWLRETMLVEGKISGADIDLLQICDDPQHAVAIVERAAARQGRG
jgi:predicted Rossmann-fold nucleotide-binding protein